MRIIVGLILGMALLASGTIRAAEVDFGRYHALVIGNNAYQQLPDLETAVADAEAVAKLLQSKYGFEVRLLRDATKRDILRAVNRYRADLTERDNLLIYYAGHGWLDRQTKTGYWQPVDAEDDDDLNWIANGEITRRLNALSARHVTVIADSCYSGTLVREAASRLPTGAEREAWLKRVSEKRSRTAIVSGGLEPVADAGRGGHSVFASALLETLDGNTGFLEGNELFRRLSRPVVVNSDQTPQYSDIRRAGHEGGEFIFVPQGSTVVVVPPAKSAPSDLRALDLEFWNAIKNDDDPSIFEAYLEQFPNGTFVALARRRIEKLKAGARQPPAKTQTAMAVPPAPAIDIAEMDETFVAIRNVNLRSGPSTKSRKVATLKMGVEVAVTGKVKGAKWYRIAHGDAEAYVYAPLLQEKNAWAEAKAKAEQEAKRQAEARLEAENDAKRKAEAERQRVAAVTPSKPVSSTSKPPLHDCDKYAASPSDKRRVAPGVPFSKINTSVALRACKRAVAAFPNSDRFAYQYGRVFAAAKNYAEAARWYRKAAEQGHASAQNGLAWMYNNGKGVAKNYAEAVRWYRKAAEQGHASAQYSLGLRYAKGKGVAKDYAEAARW